MAHRDFSMALNYSEMEDIANVDENVTYGDGNEIVAYDNGRENISYDVQASEDGYCLSTSSPEFGKPNLTKHLSSSELKQYNMRTRSNGNNEGSSYSTSARHNRKSQDRQHNKLINTNDLRKRTRSGQNKYARNKIVHKSCKFVCKTKISKMQDSRSSLISDEKTSFLDSASEPKVRALTNLKKNHNSSNAKAVKLSHLKLTHANNPTKTPTLLSMMAEAVSAPQYVSSHTSRLSPASEFLECPVRSSWPLLREMISKPPVNVVSISSAPRQTLSTVLVDAVNSDEPKANVISKLEKEIRCECKFNKGQPCWLLFQEDRLRKERLHHLTLKRESLDLVILAKIAANINREEKTKKYSGRNRQRCRVCYYHEGRQICRETFMFIHGICKGRLCALMQHYKKKGLSVRVHGNTSNVPHHALSYSDSERVIDYIREYANNHCISLFGRKPGSKAGGGLLIMSSTQSKLYIHHKYKVWCMKNNHRAVSLRSFQNLWTKHLPYIVVLRGSNKNPVPEPGSQRTMLDSHDDITLENELVPVEVTSEKSLQVISKSSGSNLFKDGKSKNIISLQHADCGTNTDFDFYYVTDGRKKEKRKEAAPRKVEISTCLPLISGDRNFEDNRNCDDPNIINASLGSIHSSINSTSSIIDNNNHNDGLQNLHPQPDLNHSIFNNDLHISQSTSASALPDHPTAVLNFQSQPPAASMMLTSSKDILYTYNNKTSVSMTKASSLHSPLYLTQPVQLLDSYSIQCSEKFPPPVLGSHGLVDQLQTVMLPHQSSDFSNVHQFDWQGWQSYNT